MKSFKTLLNRKNQRFICEICSSNSEKRHEVEIYHYVLPGIDPTTLSNLDLDLPEDFQNFYAQFGQVNFYVDKKFGDYAFLVAHPDQWTELHHGFMGWVDACDPDDEFTPGWARQAIVFGEIPCSGNYFLISLDETNKYHVYEFEHDGFEFVLRGKTFSEFIDWLCHVDAKLLDTIAGHTRYEDGKTSIQWIPIEYRYN